VDSTTLQEHHARERTGAWFYGALVSASVLVAAGAHTEDYRYIALTTLGAVITFWLAHIYTHAQSLTFTGDARHIVHRVNGAARHESGVLFGGLPAIAVYVAVVVIWDDKATAALVAVWFSVVLFIVAAYVGAQRAGRSRTASLIDAAIAGLFGIIVVIGKALLH
jgi:hypothetical protein